jgi:hypothetical protein
MSTTCSLPLPLSHAQTEQGWCPQCEGIIPQGNITLTNKASTGLGSHRRQHVEGGLILRSAFCILHSAFSSMTESQYIIERSSPIELRDLHRMGVALPHHLLAKMERDTGPQLTLKAEAIREGRFTRVPGRRTHTPVCPAQVAGKENGKDAAGKDAAGRLRVADSKRGGKR